MPLRLNSQFGHFNELNMHHLFCLTILIVVLVGVSHISVVKWADGQFINVRENLTA